MKHNCLLYLIILCVIAGCSFEKPAEKAAKLRSDCLTKSIEAKYPEALTLCNESLAVDSKDHRTYKILASIYCEQKQYDKAIENLNKIIELSKTPNVTEAVNNRTLYGIYMELGKNYEKKKDKASALNAYNNAKSQDPSQQNIVDRYIIRLNQSGNY